MANQIVTEVVLDLDKLREQLASAEWQAEIAGKLAGKKFGDESEKRVNSAFDSIFGGYKKLIGLIASLGAGFALKKGIEEAIESENAVKGLNNALALTGQYTAATSQKLQEYAESLEMVTGVEDDVIINGQAMLISLGKLRGEGLERATSAALELAAVTGISTEQAFELMTKAANGNAEALRRYGIIVEANKDKNIEFANTLRVLEQFSGSAASKVNTFEGAILFFERGISKVLESIGALITKSPSLVAVLKTITQDMFNLAKQINNSFEGQDALRGFISGLINVGININRFVIYPLELVFNIMKTGTLVVATFTSIFIQALVYIGDGIFNLLFIPFRFFMEQLGKVVAYVDKDMAQSFQNFGAGAGASIRAGFSGVEQQMSLVTSRFAEMTANSAGKAFDFSVADSVANYGAKLNEVVAQAAPLNAEATNKMLSSAGPQTESLFALLKQKMTQFAEFTKQFANQVGTAVQTFTSGLSRGFAQVGTNLVQGQSAFKNFGKIMLGVLGDIAIQFGSFFILTGVGKLILGDPSGAGLIAAGVGLSILGGVLKGLSGGESGVGGAAAAAGAGGGGGVSGAAGGGLEVQSFSEEDREKTGPKTDIAVNIQGNVLDRRQTGLEIVEVLTEAFGTNGLTVTGNA